MNIEEFAAEVVRLASMGGAGLGVVLLVLLVGAVVVVVSRYVKLPEVHGEPQPPYRPVEEESLPGTPVPQADPEHPGGDCK